MQEIRFTGFKDKKKGSSNKKKRGNASAAKSPYVPLFDEDSDGNIIVNENPKDIPSLQTDKMDVTDRYDAHQSKVDNTSPKVDAFEILPMVSVRKLKQPNAPNDATDDQEALAAKKPQSDVGKLASIPITNHYGAMLTDQQRVDRFNDLRAFQLLQESQFADQDVSAELASFLERELKRRTKSEAMHFYETRMSTIDHDFIYN